MALDTTKYDAAEILTYLQESGTISLGDVAARMKKEEKLNILKNHPYPITQGVDGRWRTYVKSDGEKRRQIAKSSREKVEDALVDFYNGIRLEKAEKKITLEVLYPSWCEYKVLHRAASSYMTRINNDWKSYYAGTDIVKVPVNKLDKMTLDVWAHELIQKVGNAGKAYYNASIIMRQVLDYAVDTGVIKENIFRQIKIDSKMVFDPVKKKPSEEQVFTKEEVDALYEAAWKDFKDGHNPVQRLAPLAVMFQFQTGLRISELVTVRYEDICGSELYVSRFYRVHEKEIVEYLKGHNEGRYVPLTAEAVRLIEAARQYQQENGLKDDGYIFSINKDPLSYYAVSQLYNRYCDIIDTNHKSSHKSRKTYISALIDGGVNINTIRETVGHSDEKTTYKSYCFDRKTKSERIELIEKALS